MLIITEKNELGSMKILITSDWDFGAVNGVVISIKDLKVELEN